jgi:hypothetical protein
MLWIQRLPEPAFRQSPMVLACACLGPAALAVALDAVAWMGPALMIPWIALVHSQRSARKNAAPHRNATFLALLGSCAAFIACRQIPALSQLLSDLAQKGPEFWRTARVQSPPDVFHALQRCARADAFHGFARSAERRLSCAVGPLRTMIRLLAGPALAHRLLICRSRPSAYRLKLLVSNPVGSHARLECFAHVDSVHARSRGAQGDGCRQPLPA